MVRIMLGLVAALMLTACGEKAISEDGTYVRGLRTVKIDGCEYLVYENSDRVSQNYSFAICHKGNCGNPIHVYRKPTKVVYEDQ